MAYLFTLDEIPLPVTPGKVEITYGGSNKTVTLINGGEINIPKDGKLTAISFDCLLPGLSAYPFAYYENGAFKEAVFFIEHFKKLKASKKPFKFAILRNKPGGGTFYDSRFDVLLESFEIKEEAANGFDVTVSIELKEYRKYGAIRLVNTNGAVSAIKETPRLETKAPASSYTIKSGDTLYNIAKKELGSGEKWKQLYELNKDVIEAAAKKYGKASSSNGWWIYPGCELRLS